MCTKNPTEGGQPRHADTETDLIFKCVFCNYLQIVGADVGHGPVGTLFLSLILFLVPDPNYILLCWPGANSLVCMMLWPWWVPLTQVARDRPGGLVPLNKCTTYHRSVDYLV